MQQQDSYKQQGKSKPEVHVARVEGPGLEMEISHSTLVHTAFAGVTSHGSGAEEVGNIEEYSEPLHWSQTENCEIYVFTGKALRIVLDFWKHGYLLFKECKPVSLRGRMRCYYVGFDFFSQFYNSFI